MRTSANSDWTEQARLIASDGQAGDHFGESVDIHGDTIVVGAFQSDAGELDSGSCYIFARMSSSDTPKNWTEVSKLTASDGEAEARFGESVAIWEDAIAVGAENDDENGIDVGSAYVFTRSESDSSIWTEQAKLSALGGATLNNFGESVAISGTTIVVGADEAERDGRGSAYVFSLKDSAWTQQMVLMASDGGARHFFGYNVAVSRDTVGVGADGDDETGDGSGSAYLYTLGAF